MESFSTKKNEKNSVKYCCEICHFNTCKKQDYSRHLLTMKHKINTSSTSVNIKNEKIHICALCEKNFKDRSGLWKHKKKCIPDDKIEENESESDSESDAINEPTEKELIMMLIKQNSLLIEQNASLVKNGVNNSNSHNTISNSNNKTFNLQFFLNETCKNAMNLTDFVNNIQLQLCDLEKMGEIGYVEGLSNIIINNLKELDVTERPVHCADKKREVLYVKDEDKWEKENEEREKIRKAIKRISSKNCLLINQFKEIHPDCTKYHSKYGDQYNKMMYEAYGGKGDNDMEKENKIISHIAKNVTIDKAN